MKWLVSEKKIPPSSKRLPKLYLRNDWLKKSLTGQGVTLDED